MRILFVGMANSIHTARWIGQIANEKWNIHLFPVDESPLHPELKSLTLDMLFQQRIQNKSSNIRQNGLWWPFKDGATLIGRAAEKIFPRLTNRPARLARVIRKFKPDIVHSLEIQHAGYLTLDAKAAFSGNFPNWVVTNWGSDISLFGRFPEHVNRINAVLSACDFYSCESQRDVKLAKGFGFHGQFFPTVPNAGGFHLNLIRKFRQPGLTSTRRLIALKGYQHWAGRALVCLRAIEIISKLLKGYRVAVYLATPDVILAAKRVAHSTGLQIDIVPDCSHEDMLRLHGSARISIGLSISDAISTSLLEAMVMGSFPIQSNTGCADEWVRNGETGLIVPPEDPGVVAEAIQRAVTDDSLVDQAAEINDRVAIERLDVSFIQPQVIEMYERVASEKVIK